MEDEDPTYVEFLTKSANEISLFWNDLDYERNAFIFAFRLYFFLKNRRQKISRSDVPLRTLSLTISLIRYKRQCTVSRSIICITVL